MNRSFLLFLLFLLINGVSVFAQNTQLKGIVIDALTSEKIPFATIAMYNKVDLVDGTSANENGVFQLNTDKEWTHLDLSFIGYKTTQVLPSEIENQKEFTISLIADVHALEEIIVEGERTTTQLKIDRKVINLGSDIQQGGTSVLEAFDQIVDIQVDLSTGSLSLRGSGNVRLLINGKPSPLSATELLEQIPSSSVDRIEIITSPSARQQADGLSGIVNVILKRNKNKGLNINTNASVGTKRYGFGFQGNYNFSFLNFRLSVSQNDRDMDNNERLDRFFKNGDTETIITPYLFSGRVKRIASGVDLFINPKNELSFEFDYTDNSHSFYNKSAYTNVSRRDDYDYLRTLEHFHLTNTFNGNYRRKFKKEGHFLELDYNLNRNQNRFPASNAIDDVFLSNETNISDNTLQAAAIDYVLPVNEKTTFEAGLSWNNRKLKSTYILELAGENPTAAIFNYTEQVMGVYALSSFVTGKINWQAGLRYEYFMSDSDNSRNSILVNKTFSNLFPSLHASYSVNDNNTLNVGYSRRVSRPNFRHINPFQLGNLFFRFEGNPDLRPEFSDNIELNYQYKGNDINWSVAAFYRHRKEVIQRLDRIEDNTVQVVNYQNLGANKTYGIEANTNFKPASFLSTVISANYYFTEIDEFSAVTWSELYSSNIQLKNTVKINNRFSTDLTYRHTPKRQQAFRFIEPRNRIDFAVRGKFFHKKLTINLRIVDILNQNLMKRNTVTEGFTQSEVWRFQAQTRNYLLSINYRLFEDTSLSRSRKKRNYRHGGMTD